ncbi:helix-turn-helix domain-containing protein [Exiguobacterium mexicanum]|uniref:helix-turn-helix domain-containing protein n=1 Tax=Exiguobacterium mexicanum TaxID=340146 RepID=UPI0037BEB9D0
MTFSSYARAFRCHSRTVIRGHVVKACRSVRGALSELLVLALYKEVSLSSTEYVLREKVTVAKKLLKYTDDPISEIYTWLIFRDQSQFLKVFKQYTGMTPKQFKSREAMTAL